MLLCYKWLNSLWGAVGLHGVPVHQVRSEGMDEGTERLAVTPGARHVGDGDPRVGAQHQPAPLLQRLAAWHPHGVWCHLSLVWESQELQPGMILCVLSSHWLGDEVTALSSQPMGGQEYWYDPIRGQTAASSLPEDFSGSRIPPH